MKSVHDHIEGVQSYKLPYVPGMARLVKSSLYELHQNWNMNVQSSKTVEIKLTKEDQNAFVTGQNDELTNRPPTQSEKDENDKNENENKTDLQKVENKFNRNFILVLKTVQSYKGLFS